MSRILGDRKMPGRPRHVAVGSSAATAAVRLVASRVFMIDLPAVGRSAHLLRDDSTQRQESPIAIGLGKGLPEVRERDSRTRLQPARGGTCRDGRFRMMTLRIETVPGEAGSNRPASEVPRSRLWEAARRIDKAQLQVQSVCFFWSHWKAG